MYPLTFLQALRKVLHAVFRSDADGIGQLVIFFFKDQLAYGRRELHDLDRRHAADARLDALKQFLSHNAFHVEGNRRTNRSVHLFWKQVENTTNRGRSA